MKKRIVAYFFTMVLLLSSSVVAMADPVYEGDVYVGEVVSLVKITVVDPTHDTLGGPFAVSTHPGNEYIFTSFCLERNEYLFEPMIVSSITNYAEAGGIGGAVNGKDSLDVRTAFLYYQYRSGVQFDLNALQIAIWLIEEETDDSGAHLIDTERAFLDLAKDYRTLAAAAVANGWSKSNEVGVMNLSTLNGIPAQSQLTLVPEPMTLILFGLGLFGLVGIARKLKK